VRRRERRVPHSTRALEPTSSTVPAATENYHQNDDDDQKRRGVHHCLLFEAQRIGVPPREGEFHLRGERSGSVPGLARPHRAAIAALPRRVVPCGVPCCALRSVAERHAPAADARSGCHSQQAASMPRAPRPARATMLDDGVGPLASKMSSTTSDRRAKFSRTTEHDS
jgi:hypothetical protein